SLDGIELAAALALASIAKSHKYGLVPETDAIQAARSALIRLPLALLGAGAGSLAVLADGRLVSRGLDDNTITHWPTEGKGKPAVLLPGSADWSLADKSLQDKEDKSKAVLADGRLVTAGKDGNI